MLNRYYQYIKEDLDKIDNKVYHSTNDDIFYYNKKIERIIHIAINCHIINEIVLKIMDGNTLIKVAGYGFLFLVFIGISMFLHSIPMVITIQSSGFDPNNTGIYPGTVIWVNNDTKTHRIVSDYGWFDSGNLSPGQNYTYDFSWHKTGYYPYHDSLNTSLKGRIHVMMIQGGD